MNMIHHHHVQQVQYHLVLLIVMKEDLFISFLIINHYIPSIIVVFEYANERLPNSIDCNEGRSIRLISIYNGIIYFE